MSLWLSPASEKKALQSSKLPFLVYFLFFCGLFYDAVGRDEKYVQIFGGGAEGKRTRV